MVHREKMLFVQSPKKKVFSLNKSLIQHMKDKHWGTYSKGLNKYCCKAALFFFLNKTNSPKNLQQKSKRKKKNRK